MTEATGESSEVSSRIFWKGERMVAAEKAGLESAEHGVHPLHAQLLRQRKPREIRLRPADHVDRQEPHGRRQLATLHDGVGNERGLMPIGIRLKGFLRTPTQKMVRRIATPRGAKTVRPRHRLQGRCVLRLGSEALPGGRHRQTVLKLDSIPCHGTVPCAEMTYGINPASLTT